MGHDNFVGFFSEQFFRFFDFWFSFLIFFIIILFFFFVFFFLMAVMGHRTVALNGEDELALLLIGSKKSWISQLLSFVASSRYFVDQKWISWAGMSHWSGIFSDMEMWSSQTPLSTQMFVRKLMKLMQKWKRSFT